MTMLLLSRLSVAVESSLTTDMAWLNSIDLNLSRLPTGILGQQPW